MLSFTLENSGRKMCAVDVFVRGRAARNCQGLVFSWFIVLTAGCGSGNQFPVSGKVVHKDGTPITAGMVVFEPLNQKISARGEIKSDGTFQIGTHGNNDGAMEGEYKVVIAPPPLPEEGKRFRAPISQKYQSLETTPLKFTVTKDARKNKLNINLD
jgi:hypothetical protein